MQAGGLNARMSSGLLFMTDSPRLLGISALTPLEMTIAAALAVVPVFVVGLVMQSRARKQQAEARAAYDRLKEQPDSDLLTEQARARAAAADAADKLDALSAKLADVEQRYATHREVADRRLNDASQQVARLESDLAATREVAAQLPPTQARIKDLETALASEQGRFAALEKAVEAHNSRSADLEKRLVEAQALALKAKGEADDREHELKRFRAEQDARAAEGGVEAELKKAKEAHVQYETKIAQLQKNITAAEARVTMVQKEFMNAVGVPSAPVPGRSGVAMPSPSGSDKRVRELEDKVAQLETESRKKAREDGYKIAELEYRLSEALEKSASPADPAPAVLTEAPAEQPPPAAEPPPEPTPEPLESKAEPEATNKTNPELDLGLESKTIAPLAPTTTPNE